MAPDILRRIQTDFGPEDADIAIGLLNRHSGPEKSRVARYLLHPAEGSTPRLEARLATTHIDYRDVILFAEYDRLDRGLHDFSRPFRE